MTKYVIKMFIGAVIAFLGFIVYLCTFDNSVTIIITLGLGFEYYHFFKYLKANE